jgi:hypothetical protein
VALAFRRDDGRVGCRETSSELTGPSWTNLPREEAPQQAISRSLKLDHSLTTPSMTACAEAVGCEPQPVRLWRTCLVGPVRGQARAIRRAQPTGEADPLMLERSDSLEIPATRWSEDGGRSRDQLDRELIDVTLTSRPRRRCELGLESEEASLVPAGRGHGVDCSSDRLTCTSPVRSE